MLTEPVGQLAVIEPALGEIEHNALLRIGGSIDFAAVEDEEGLHGGMPDALVAIDKRVALDQRQTQRRGLLRDSGIQVSATERGLGLGDCRLQRAEVPDAGRAACRLQEAPMQLDVHEVQDALRDARGPWEQKAALVYSRYEKRIREAGGIQGTFNVCNFTLNALAAELSLDKSTASRVVEASKHEALQAVEPDLRAVGRIAGDVSWIETGGPISVDVTLVSAA